MDRALSFGFVASCHSYFTMWSSLFPSYDLSAFRVRLPFIDITSTAPSITATGGTFPFIPVTVAVSVLVLPALSFTVNCTTYLPTNSTGMSNVSPSVCLFRSIALPDGLLSTCHVHVIPSGPSSGSVLPLALQSKCALAPAPTSTNWSGPAFATGGWSATVTFTVSVELNPRLSVTVNCATYSPALSGANVNTAVSAVVPFSALSAGASVISHAYVMLSSGFGSYEPLPSSVTCVPGFDDTTWSLPAFATGATFPCIAVTTTVAMLLFPAVSSTFNSTTYLPAISGVNAKLSPCFVALVSIDELSGFAAIRHVHVRSSPSGSVLLLQSIFTS